MVDLIFVIRHALAGHFDLIELDVSIIPTADGVMF